MAVQLTSDRDSISAIDERVDERAARLALRSQVAKLERELAEIVAESFPYVAVPAEDISLPSPANRCGPSLLDLGQLERTRDELAGRIQRARRAVVERSEHHARAHQLLERMKLEPGRYKFVRLPVRELGEGGCGVWEVRPRLGLIGMLAGWWQVKLSSGCPLGWGSRESVAPGGWAPIMWGSRESVAPILEGGMGAAGLEHRHEGLALAVGEGAEGLLLGHGHLGEEFARAGLAPAALAGEEVGDGHAGGLPGAVQQDIGNVELAGGDLALEAGARQAHLVGSLERAQVLWPARPGCAPAGRGHGRCRVHDETLPVAPPSPGGRLSML
ncbi:MAG TPA: hypothetical protein VMG62_03885 [Solirubrobacteraceae bacterium]|nr:hypothetical protein [Solirubrobacteraceae bacterium]